MKIYFSSLIFAIALVAVLLGYNVFAFQPPAAAPPGANVDAPINVSSAMQEKGGVLRVHGFRSFEDMLVVKDGGDAYLQLDTVTGAPAGGDCGAGTEGRTIIDTSNSRLYVCIASVWKWVTLN
ncbi:MAG: hypothetical protein HYT49_02870 [Candidatus Wildermuthbacteria bacterium]|nr:hypothetical protein [Candidatus Wildermuthbacteria bacterium]